MDRCIYGCFPVTIFFFLFFLLTASALPQNLESGHHNLTGSGQINSNSVLVALLDSRYTELAELVEKALLLQILEDAVGRHNITIFAPRNEALEGDLDPDFKRFLLQPGNLKISLLLSHIIPKRVGSNQWPDENSGRIKHATLGHNQVLQLSKIKGTNGKRLVNSVVITRRDYWRKISLKWCMYTTHKSFLGEE